MHPRCSSPLPGELRWLAPLPALLLAPSLRLLALPGAASALAALARSWQAPIHTRLGVAGEAPCCQAVARGLARGGGA
eukprot:14258669-Alexandrium_andersonii.AAC.1